MVKVSGRKQSGKIQYKRRDCYLKKKSYNSPMWNDLIKIKDLYLAGRIVKIGNGIDIDFWSDPWCGNVALKEKFRDLYEINNEQYTSVAEMAQRSWRLTFRR
jgi:hypothetical protein